MEQYRPELGKLGIAVVQTILPGFCEKKFLFWGKRKLTLAKYLGAYTTVASQGLLVGLRFRHVPLAAAKLVCGEGRELDLAEWLRQQASSLASQFRGREAGFLDISMLRERARLLRKPGESNPDLLDDPFALERFLSEARVDLSQTLDNLVACFSIFLGLGLFESDWAAQVYMRFMPDEAQLQKDTHHLVELVRSWLSQSRPDLVAELFPSESASDASSAQFVGG